MSKSVQRRLAIQNFKEKDKMIDGKKYRYGFENGKPGVEATYTLLNNIVYVKIPGINHWKDVLSSLLAWPRIKVNGAKYHRKWYDMALELFTELLKFKLPSGTKFKIMGTSMGGAIGHILSILLNDYLYDAESFSINSPKIGNKKTKVKLIRNTSEAFIDKGDFVRHLPFFYAKYPWVTVFGNTKGLRKAHIHMPSEYYLFPL